jgi:hypothetical protein
MYVTLPKLVNYDNCQKLPKMVILRFFCFLDIRIFYFILEVEMDNRTIYFEIFSFLDIFY